ncbi:MAG TPA: DNA polymerase/3'-5' exonuclease PolX, partial [Chloroflexia bacterium]|nr:DNA polymerase/3'-5' exonuclease PolX [Chloroflexia bacterium]
RLSFKGGIMAGKTPKAKKDLTPPADLMPVPGITNMSLAQTMQEIAAMLELKGENRFKIQSYRRAADTLLNMPEDIRTIWRLGTLDDLPNIGEAISSKIDELLRTGHLAFYERLRAEIPPGVLALTAIPDVGPKSALALYQALNVSSIEELETALAEGRVRTVPGFGAKSEQKLRESLEAAKRRASDTRILLAVARPLARQIVTQLRESGLPIDQIEVAGSMRRGRSTIGDMDILCTSPAATDVIRFFTELPVVGQVVSHGDNKSTVRLRNGLQVDLMVLPPEHFGSLLHHFTGSREHNIQMRDRALDRGLKLNEYGFDRPDGTRILCAHEEEVFATLGLPWIPPELREGAGEIEAAAKGRLPNLVTVADIKGDLHNHSKWSDGTVTIEEMARAARDRGYEYMAITDHSQSLTIANGLTVERIREQAQEVAEVNRKLAPFRVLHGVELEIKTDGTLDYPDDVLASLDIVVASLHQGLRHDPEAVTERVLNACRNPHVDIIGHPTGQILGSRDPSGLDVDALIAVARETGTALEINASPERLDLNEVYTRRAMDAGVLLTIDTDSHHPDGFENIEYGITVARRGWATAPRVLTTWSRDEVVAWLQRRG